MIRQLRHLFSLLLFAFATPTSAQEPHATEKLRFTIPSRLLRTNGPECSMTVEQVIEKSRKECPSQPALFTTEKVQVEADRDAHSASKLFQKQNPLEDLIKTPKWETQVRVHLPDLMLLLEQSANCEAQSTFNRSFEKFLSLEKVSDPLSPGNNPYIRQLKMVLQQYRSQLTDLESIPGAHNAFMADLSRVRYQLLSTQNKCPIRFQVYQENVGLTPLLEAIHLKLVGKSITSVDDIYKNASAEEKKVLDLLFGKEGQSRSALNLLDFTLGPDRANHYRNLLLHGKIPYLANRGGLSLEPNTSHSLFKSPLRQVEAVNRVTDALAKIASPEPHLGFFALETLDDYLQKQTPSTRNDVRRFLKGVINKLEIAGVERTDQSDETLLRAERVRTISHRILATLDSEVPDSNSYYADIFRDMIPQDKLALVTEADTREVNPRLLRSVARTPLSGPTPFGDAIDFMDVKNLEFVLKAGEKEKVHAMSEVDMTPEDIARIQKTLHASRELYVNHLDHGTNFRAPYFYGREISEENKKLKAEDHWESDIDTIAEKLAEYHIGFSAQDRMRLNKNLDHFSLGLLAKLTQFAHTESPDSSSASFRKSVRPQIQELAKMIFEPEGKADMIQAMAALTHLNFDDKSVIYAEVASGLGSVNLKLPKGFELSNIYKASAAERDAVAAQAEDLIRNDKNLAEGTKRALVMLSFLLREEGMNPDLMYATRPLPSLMNDLSLRQQSTKHDVRKKQRDDIEASGSDGKKAVSSLDNVETFLKKHNLGFPLDAEMGLLQFLERNGKTGDETIRQLMASVPPKVFSNMVALMRPENSDTVVEMALKDYLPHSLYLLSNPKVQKDRVYAEAVQDLFKHEKLSAASEGNLNALFAKFPECTEKATHEEGVECLKNALYVDAARYTLEKGDREKADRLLAHGISDQAAREEKLEEMGHQNAQSRKVFDRLGDKKLPWSDLLNVLKYDDVNSAAEANRIEQLTSWARDVRSIERNLAEAETQRGNQKRMAMEGVAVAESRLKDIKEKARKAFEKLSDDDFKTLTGLWKQEFEQQKIIDGSIQVPYYSKPLQERAKIREQIEKLTEKSGGYLGIDERGLFVELNTAYENAKNADYRLVNPNRGQAKYLVDLAEAKQGSRLDEKGKILDPQTNAKRMIEKVVMDHPELARELEQLSQNFGLSGVLRVDSKDYTSADVENLMNRIRTATNSNPPAGSLAARAKTVIDRCAANPDDCALSAARLTELKKLYLDQSDPSGLLNLDHSGSLESAAESDVEKQNRLIELRTLQTFLKEQAQNYERSLNRTDQEAVLQRVSTQLFPELKGAQKSVAITAMRSLRDNLMWGKSLADSVAQSTPNNPPPVEKGPTELKSWMKQHGYEGIYNDWKFHMTSGLNKHRVPEGQVDGLFHEMLTNSWKRESKAADRKREIEERLAQIVPPTHTRSPDKPLWDWDQAKLHLVAPTNASDRKDHHLISYEEFTGLLNEYAEINGVSMHAINPEFRRTVRGEEELHDLVHGTLARTKYRWDTANINSNSYVSIDKAKAVADKGGISSVGVGYDFKDFAEAKPKIEKMAADMRWLLANNGELYRAIQRQGGSTEGAYRIWRALTWRDPETENDTAINKMTNEAASTLLELGLMGDSKINFNGKEVAAGAAAHALRQDFKKLLGKQHDLLQNVDLGYELTEQGIWLAAGLVAGYGVAGVAVMGAELLAAKNGVQLALAGKRLNDARQAVTLAQRMDQALTGLANLNSASRVSRAAQAINTARNAGWVAKVVGYANQSKQMLMAGLEGKLYEKGFDIVTARASMLYYSHVAENFDIDKNGTADWRDALNARKPFHFKEAIKEKLMKQDSKNEAAAEAEAVELAKLIDSDDNGIPDQADVSEFGMEPERFTMGSLTELAKEVKDNSVTMAASPWAAGILGRTALRPAARFVQKIGGGRTDWVPKYAESMKTFLGMTSTSMIKSMIDSDPDRSVMEELQRNLNRERFWQKTKDSAWNSTFTLPFDDIWALRYLSKNPNAGPRGIWLRKSLVNHGQDFLQGATQAYFSGKYTAGNGREEKNPWLAGLYNMGSSAKLSQKASDPKMAALDLIPDIVRSDIVAKAGTGNDSSFEPLLDTELETNGGKQRIRDLIKDKANLDELATPEKHEAFFKMFNKILIEQGAEPGEIANAYRKALARAGKNEVRFGEVTTFINNVAYEIKLQQLLDGKMTAQDVITTKDAASNPGQKKGPERLLRLHHLLTVGEVVKSDGSDIVNMEVKKAIWDIARDFRLNPIKFQKFVIAKQQEPGKLNEAMTLRMLAMDMMNAERVAGGQRRVSRSP